MPHGDDSDSTDENRHADELEAAHEPRGDSQPPHRSKVLTVLFCDIKNLYSPPLAPDERRTTTFPNAVARELLTQANGREVESLRESYLAAFETPSDAVRYTLRLHSEIRRLKQFNSDLPEPRYGIYQVEVVLNTDRSDPRSLYGRALFVASKLAALAIDGQILCTRSVYDDARANIGPEYRTKVAWGNHGYYDFKGLEDPIEVCEIGEIGFARFTTPLGNEAIFRRIDEAHPKTLERARPKVWHCVFCGWKCDEPYNDYICKLCQRVRPFLGGSATMIRCNTCEQMNIALAHYCEWCGKHLYPESDPL